MQYVSLGNAYMLHFSNIIYIYIFIFDIQSCTTQFTSVLGHVMQDYTLNIHKLTEAKQGCVT